MNWNKRSNIDIATLALLDKIAQLNLLDENQHTLSAGRASSFQPNFVTNST